jgi:GT2 family glycosyltransferase
VSDSPGEGAGGGVSLSVCVPTYQRPGLVQRAIASIVAAARDAADHVEIVVSDNSPDVSEVACRSALEAWPGRKLYVPNRPDIGITANFNQCVSRASGRYLLFVQDDDAMLAGAIPPILDAIAEGRDPVLLFGVHLVDDGQRVIRRQELCLDHRVEPADAVERLLSDNGMAWFPALVISRDALVAAGPFDDAFGNAMDLEMWLRLFARHGVRCIPEAISAYTIHADSATQQMGFDEAAVSRILAIFERARAMRILPEDEIAQCEASYFHQFILGAAAARLRAGDRAGARRIMALFQLPAIRTLGSARPWGPLRTILSMMARLPAPLPRPLMRLIDRLDLVRRVRAAQNRSRDGIQVC